MKFNKQLYQLYAKKFDREIRKKRQLHQWKKEQKTQIPNPKRDPYDKTFKPTENRKEMIYFHRNEMIRFVIL